MLDNGINNMLTMLLLRILSSSKSPKPCFDLPKPCFDLDPKIIIMIIMIFGNCDSSSSFWYFLLPFNPSPSGSSRMIDRRVASDCNTFAYYVIIIWMGTNVYCSMFLLRDLIARLSRRRQDFGCSFILFDLFISLFHILR